MRHKLLIPRKIAGMSVVLTARSASDQSADRASLVKALTALLARSPGWIRRAPMTVSQHTFDERSRRYRCTWPA